MTELPGTAADPSTPSPALAFQVLGPLRVTRDGTELPLGGRQQRAVLAALLLSPDTPRTVDQLADALWGDAVPGGVVSTLQTYVSHLREILEPGRARRTPPVVLRTEGRGYRLHPGVDAVDAAVFERRVRTGRDLLARGDAAEASTELSAALDLWRGDVIADLAEFAFVQAEAQRLDQVRVGAIETRVEADLALGRHRDVVDELDRLVAAYPLREGLHAHRMLARYRCGRQADALAAYRELREVLADELGIDPSPSLQRLQERILAQDPALEPPPKTVDVVRPAAEAPLPPRPAPAVTASAPRRRRTRVWVAGTSGVAVLVAGAIAAVVWSGPDTVSALPANTVGIIDADGGLRSSLPVGTSPEGVAYGAGFVWVTSTAADTLSMVDPEDNRVVQTIEVGDAPNAVTVTGDDVWVANGGDATVSRVNARTRRPVGTPIAVGNVPAAIAAGPSGVWVANSGDNTIQRIDPTTGAAGAAVGVGSQPTGIAVGDATIWVSDFRDGAVWAVNAASGQPETSIAVGNGPRGLAVTDDAVWVANSLDGTVSRVDRARRTVTLTVAVGDGARSIVAGTNAVWVSDESAGTVARIDPRHVDDVRRIATGSSPHGLALVGSTVWVASVAFAGNEHRGGTLVIEDFGLPDFSRPDPAGSYQLDLVAMMYDGLVAQRRTAGPGAGTIVPDLATELPHPTDGGRTYTFTVRRGVHYSDGAEVRADDIRRGVQRTLQFSGAGEKYFAAIIGAPGCIADYPTCDLSRGVVVDDAASTITFHLVAPDPEFLQKLSVFAVATAPGVPMTESPTPIPATGPYMFGKFDKDATDQLTIVRNPQFHVWSAAAQPDGFPRQIQWKNVESARTRADDVLAGRADIADVTDDAATQSDIATRFPDRLHLDATYAMYYEFLNTKVAPFNDIRVRQALNYAVDRTRVALMFHPGNDAVTCQVLPPDFPGYQPYCPYTRPPLDGQYHGPALDRARALVKAAGTAGKTPVTLWTGAGSRFEEPTRYYAQVLEELGYRTTVRAVTRNDLFEAISSPTRQIQMGSNAWLADFTTASNFWEPVLSCDSFTPKDNNNYSGYCNEGVDASASHAVDVGATDPAAANLLWAAIYRRITDDAPWIFGPNGGLATVVSSRVGNYQFDPVIHALYTQLWVQ